MTQEDEKLLLIDLAPRIPYNVIGQVTYNRFPKEPYNKVIDGNLYDRFARAQDNWYDNVQIIPYLRKMSDMTDEEKVEYQKTMIIYQADYCPPEYFDDIKSYDWLNAHHFDYRGLIKKGLALEATENMYAKTIKQN